MSAYKRRVFEMCVACVLVGAGCSSDPSAPLDRAEDVGVSEDMSVMALDDMKGAGAPDQQATTPDMMGVSEDMSQPDLIEDLGVFDQGGMDQGDPQDMFSEDMRGGDAGEDMREPDMMTPDMFDMTADMGGGVDYSDRVKGDCVRSSQCGSPDLFCERSAVGGTCFGPCSACDDIPGSGTYECIAGACVAECSDDTECAPGRTCNVRRGVCVVQRCSQDVCPVPWFGCSEPEGICVRVACDAGQVCPAQTQCDGSYCIEDHIVR